MDEYEEILKLLNFHNVTEIDIYNEEFPKIQKDDPVVQNLLIYVDNMQQSIRQEEEYLRVYVVFLIRMHGFMYIFKRSGLHDEYIVLQTIINAISDNLNVSVDNLLERNEEFLFNIMKSLLSKKAVSFAFNTRTNRDVRIKELGEGNDDGSLWRKYPSLVIGFLDMVVERKSGPNNSIFCIWLNICDDWVLGSKKLACMMLKPLIEKAEIIGLTESGWVDIIEEALINCVYFDNEDLYEISFWAVVHLYEFLCKNHERKKWMGKLGKFLASILNDFVIRGDSLNNHERICGYIGYMVEVLKEECIVYFGQWMVLLDRYLGSEQSEPITSRILDLNIIWMKWSWPAARGYKYKLFFLLVKVAEHYRDDINLLNNLKQNARLFVAVNGDEFDEYTRRIRKLSNKFSVFPLYRELSYRAR